MKQFETDFAHWVVSRRWLVLVGIVVDDTVHFMSKYLLARRENGLDPADAVRYSFSAVGTAMWVTTLALALDFLFLPLLLMKIDGGKR